MRSNPKSGMKSKKSSGASRKRNSARDLFAVIKQDHRTVEDLFKRIERANDSESCMEYYEQLRTELTIHAATEERVLYPKLKEKDPTREIAFESLEEHDVVKHLLSKIDGLEVENEEWEAAVYVLHEVVSHHVEEEEGEMFSKMRRAFPKEDREAILMEYESTKEELRGDDRMVA